MASTLAEKQQGELEPRPGSGAGNRPLPLSGIRVINFGGIWAGSVMGQMMGDMGAEVIRIESANRPDINRLQGISNGPLNLGRSMYSATLNTRDPRARELVLELAGVSDIVADNYRPGTMQASGLGYERLREVNPTIIALSASAAGQTGPLTHISTYGSNVSCLGGLDSVQGHEDIGLVPAGFSITDPLLASIAVYAMLAALRHRERTGEGQFIDLSQWEATVGLMSGPFLDYVMNGRIHGPMGNRDLMMAPHGLFPCQGEDRWVSIAVRTDEQWRALCLSMDRPDLAEDRRFADLFLRQRNWQASHDIVTEWTIQHDRWDLALALQARGVPAFPLFSDEDAFRDRHYWERQAWVKSQHPVVGSKTVFGLPCKLSRTPGTMDLPCPAMGQDNDFVFSGLLGLSSREVRALADAKVVY